jgi:predicted DNA-binding transcriptional regulator AlpA
MDRTTIARRMLSRPEAAAYCGLSVSYLAKCAVYGGGPRYAKIGRRCAYDVRDLDLWLSSQKISSSSEGAR